MYSFVGTVHKTINLVGERMHCSRFICQLISICSLWVGPTVNMQHKHMRNTGTTRVTECKLSVIIALALPHRLIITGWLELFDFVI